jgi:hypothetical protein
MFGDSVIGGWRLRPAPTGANRRWPDFLMRGLRAERAMPGDSLLAPTEY